MSQKLRLHFNERSDFSSAFEEQYPFGGTLWQYPDRKPLEKRLAELNNLDPSQVICTNGGDEAIMILMRLIKETSQLILPLPAFSQYVWGVESWQLDAKVIPGNDDFSINVNETIAAIKESTGAVVIITRPNNPSGELISIDSLINIIETAADNNSRVFLDEAYIEFSDEDSVATSLLNKYDNLVILRTLSKAYGLAGIRLGYLLGQAELIKEFDKRCAPFNVATPTLKIAAKALSDENQTDVDDYCQKIRENRNQLSDWLTSNNIPVLPSQANFLVLSLPKLQAKAIESFLAKNGILVRTFTDKMSDCLRITIPYKINDLMQLLKQALNPDLICLDMDGVLIDTSGSYDATIIETVLQLSNKVVEQKAIDELKASGGYNNDWVVTQKLLSELGIELELEAVTELFQRIYVGENNDGLVANETSIINSSLTNLIQQSKKTAFAIVTGRPLVEARAGKSLVGLEALDLISLDCVENAKPSPEGIQRLQKKYSTLSWMCGDNPDDMQAAVASNSLAIGIADETKQQTLYQAGADVVLNNINELENWLCPLK